MAIIENNLKWKYNLIESMNVNGEESILKMAWRNDRKWNNHESVINQYRKMKENNISVYNI